MDSEVLYKWVRKSKEFYTKNRCIKSSLQYGCKKMLHNHESNFKHITYTDYVIASTLLISMSERDVDYLTYYGHSEFDAITFEDSGKLKHKSVIVRRVKSFVKYIREML